MESHYKIFDTSIIWNLWLINCCFNIFIIYKSTLSNMEKNKQNIDSKQLISEIKQLLSKPKLTVENMIFSDVNEEDFEKPDEFNDGYEEEKEVETVPEESGSEVDVTDTINKIRQLALQAIAKLADNPTSEQYQLLKKVWNIVDKAFESKDNKQTSNGDI